MHACTHACMHAELRTLGWIKKFVQFYKNPSTAAEMTWESVRDWCTAFHVFTDVPEEVRERLWGVYVLKQCSCKTFRHYYICAHVRIHVICFRMQLGLWCAGIVVCNGEARAWTCWGRICWLWFGSEWMAGAHYTNRWHAQVQACVYTDRRCGPDETWCS